MKFVEFINIIGVIVFGTCTSLSLKIMMYCESRGFNGEITKFEKPFTQSLIMFIAMLCIYPLKYTEKKEVEGRMIPLPKRSFREIFLPCIPSFCDLIASTLNVFGLKYIPLSIFQMLRSSIVVFTALLTRIFLKKALYGYQYFSVALTTFALLLIGFAATKISPVKTTDDSSDGGINVKNRILGCFMVISSQFVQACQMVGLEDLSSKLGGLELVGLEGLWGIIMMCVFALPLAYIIPGSDPSPLNGSLENIFGSVLQISNSLKLSLILLFFFLVDIGFNISIIIVIKYTSAVNFTIVDAIRTLLVWITMLISSHWKLPFSERWSSWSYLELFGFILTIISSLINNKIIRCNKIFKYPDSPVDVRVLKSDLLSYGNHDRYTD